MAENTHSSPSNPTPRCGIPILIGVTGHRDLRPGDEPELRKRLTEYLTKVAEDFKASPITLLSPLAEGADRLVAEVALDLQATCGFQLVVPLPLELSDYEQDFGTGDSLQAFRKLLARAERHFVVTEDQLGHAVPEDGPDADPRDLAYTRAGFFVALHAHILLALWDGNDSDKPAGTAQIVHFRRTGHHPFLQVSEHLMAVPETGAVQHLVTPRQCTATTQGQPFTMVSLAPERRPHPAAPKAEPQATWPEAFQDRFNRDLAAHGGRPDAPITQLTPRQEQVLGYLFPSDVPPPPRTFVQAMHAHCDTLALHFQTRYRQCYRITFGLATLAFVLLELFAHCEAWRWQALRGFLAFMAIAGFLVWLATRQQWQRRYLDYRALAEAFRIQTYWELSGVSSDLASAYLASQVEELAWTRKAIRAARLQDKPGAAAPAPAGEPDLGWARFWIQDQLAFFHRTAERQRRLAHRWHRASRSLLQASLGLAGLMFLAAFLGFVVLGHNPEDFRHPIEAAIICITATLALAALSHGYNHKMAYHELARQYERMAAFFSRAQATLEHSLQRNDPVRTREILARIGREALVENADWVLLHRVRPMEVPIP